MSVKIFVKLQSPSVELKVQAQDCSGAKDSIVVGFKRYDIVESKARAEKLQDLQTQLYLNTMVELSEQYKLVNIDNETKPSATPRISEEEALNSISQFIKDEILYIRDVNLTIEDTGIIKELKIADTRSAKPNEPLWGTPEECLSVLVDSFLESAPYRGSLIAAQQKALANLEIKDGEIKN
jgi:hypothetical protein